MNEPSYFDNPAHAAALKKEALSWVDTPFRNLNGLPDEFDFRNLKGPGGGIDCVGLVETIFYAIGATQRWNFHREHSDYSHIADLGRKVLDWLRGKVDDPQSDKLGGILTELKIPEAVIDPRAECPRDFFKPGDILAMQHGSLFHLPVIYDDDLHFVNALPRIGVVEGTIQDGTFSIHLVAAFRLRPQSAPYHPEPFV